MADFFQKKLISKCDECKVKSSNIQIKLRSPLLKSRGTGELLVVVDMVEYESSLNDLSNFLEKKGFTNYQIYSACNCRTKDFELPNPHYSLYNYCNSFNLDQLSFKCILVLGRAIGFITKSDDVPYWFEFFEFKFNPTYFYYKGKKVFPIPCLSEWLHKDNFRKYYVTQQLRFIKEELDNFKLYNTEPYEIIKIDEPNDFLNQNKQEVEIAWDTETSSLDHFDPNFKIGCITLTFDGIKGYYLPFEKIDKNLLSNFFKNKYQITANGKFDVKAMLVSGVLNSKVDEDVTLLFHLLNTERIKNGLKTIAWYINHGGYDREKDSYVKVNKIDNYLKISEKILMKYAVLDSIVTYRSYNWMKKNLVPLQQHIYDVYKKYIIPVIPVYIKAELNGMEIDVGYMKNLNNNIISNMLNLEDQIIKHAGEKFDINSSEQLGKVLQKIGLPNLGVTKKGIYKTGEPILQEWKRKGYKIADLILEYRMEAKLKSSFVGEQKEKFSENNFFLKKEENNEKIEGLAKYIKKDKKIHCNFSPGRTNSMRSLCSGPNLQQMPLRSDGGRKFRPIFKCPENSYIVELDYSGFQLRIAGILSKDKVMEDLFINKSGDMHSVTANNVFCRNISLEEFLNKKEDPLFNSYRYKAKGVNFGFIFGRGAYSFKSDIEENWSQEDIDNYIKENNLSIIKDFNEREDKVLTISMDIRTKFFQTYPSLATWITDSVSFAKNNGYMDCLLGGRRHTPYLLYENKKDKEYAAEISHYENIAVNSPVQTFEALIVYKAMVEINKQLEKRNLKSIIVAMVHDSIVLYVLKSEIKEIYKILKECTEDHTSYNIPLLTDIKAGEIWGFGRKINSENLENFS